MDAKPSSEGTVKFGEYQTWYTTFGSLTPSNSNKKPLIALHGGPGACHECMLPLSDLYHKFSIPVVFYDQIGNGKSTRLQEKNGDSSFWKVSLFIAELENLIDHLGIREQGFDVLGHSWGGMLGSEYAITQPKGLRRLVIHSSPASISTWLDGLNSLRVQLPQSIQAALDKGEREANYESKEFEDATTEFYKRHLCRVEPWPAPEIKVALDHLADDMTVYGTMYGPCEMVAIGSLKDWSVIDRLQSIEAPTLLINGKYDEAQDVCVQPFFEKVKQVKWVTFQNSSHMALVEERNAYMEAVGKFLSDDEVDGMGTHSTH